MIGGLATRGAVAWNRLGAIRRADDQRPQTVVYDGRGTPTYAERERIAQESNNDQPRNGSPLTLNATHGIDAKDRLCVSSMQQHPAPFEKL
jgi:hypothetical protein